MIVEPTRIIEERVRWIMGSISTSYIREADRSGGHGLQQVQQNLGTICGGELAPFTPFVQQLLWRQGAQLVPDESPKTRRWITLPKDVCHHIGPKSPLISAANIIELLEESVHDPMLQCENLTACRKDAQIEEGGTGGLVGDRGFVAHAPTLEYFQGRELHVFQTNALVPVPSLLLFDGSPEIWRSMA